MITSTPYILLFDTMLLSRSALRSSQVGARPITVNLDRLPLGRSSRPNGVARLHNSQVTRDGHNVAGEAQKLSAARAHSGKSHSPYTARVLHHSPLAPFPRRTHTCGALRAEDADKTVVLTGWLVPKGCVPRAHRTHVSIAKRSLTCTAK